VLARKAELGFSPPLDIIDEAGAVVEAEWPARGA